MTIGKALHPLIAALLQQIDSACCVHCTMRDWHSSTFSGSRLTMSIGLTGQDAVARLSAFASALPDIEFNLPGMFVADIVAHAVEPMADGGRLSIEALVLSDIG